MFWVEQFEALRRQCGCDMQFVESLSRCLKWDAAGGKSKVDFLKTLGASRLIPCTVLPKRRPLTIAFCTDDRFIVKQLSRPEMEVFARFAPAYFEYMADALFQGVSPSAFVGNDFIADLAAAFVEQKPTVLAKVFGIYRVSLGKQYRNVDFLVMEVRIASIFAN